MKVQLLSSMFLMPILLVTGCINTSSASQSTAIQYSVASSGTEVGIQNEELHVINSTTDLSSLLSVSSISGNVPNPDFTSTTMIAIFSGASGDCGDGLTVDSVSDNNHTVTVKATITAPASPSACTTLAPDPAPYAFVEIAKTNEPISLLISR